MFALPDNPYEILDVSKNAQIPEIRSAYRKLVLKCHPDKVTDPAQKAIKAEEFQKVQKAYEILSDDNERQRYDDMVRANELEKENAERRRQREREFTPSRTPPRTYDSDYGRSPHFTVHVKPDPGYKVRSADPPPPPPPFTKSSTWAPSSGGKSPYPGTRSAPRSFEDNIHTYNSSYDDLPPRDSRESRRSRKTSVYEEKLPRHDEERRSRKKADEDYDRAQEKARRKELEKQERKEAERRELERKEEKRRKEEKKKAEKVRDTERKRDGDDKRSRHKTPYVEDESDPIIYNVAPKAEKKSKSSSRVKEIPVQLSEAASEREIKQNATLDFAAQYLETSRSKGGAPPGLPRRQTYHYNVRHVSPPPPAVATPPPAASGVAPPPPMPSMDSRMYADDDDEPVMRSSRRRMSHDVPRAKEKTSSSSHKKSSSARDSEYVAEATRAMPTFRKNPSMPTSHSHQGASPVGDSPPKISRSQTDYVRPPPGPLPRTTTWAGEDMRERTRLAPQYYTEEESEGEVRPRRSRRTRSPDEMPSTTHYRVENGRAKPSARSGSYRDESPMGRRSSKTAYYMPEANSGRPLEHRPAYESYPSAHFPKVKTARAYDANDVRYSDLPHASSYSPREPSHVYA